MHFRVERTTKTFYLKDVHFFTVDELLRYYSRNDVPNVKGIRDLRFLYPIVNESTQLNVYDEPPRRTDLVCTTPFVAK